MSSSARDLKQFQKTVLTYWKNSGRHDLPWRATTDPYKIMVSEIMLQQTQAHRVIPYYQAFLKKFPTIKVLAKAPLSDVLRAWSGLGYNRRAKFLHQAARAVVEQHAATMPRKYEELLALPGVGEYTAKAIRVFAYNEPEVFIETNVRSVFIHHFFPKGRKVSDARLLPLIADALHARDPRTWYSALMDYGTYVKSMHPNPSRRSKHHTKQSAFKGSNRQLRGAIIRRLMDGPLSEDVLRTFDAKHSYRIALVLKGLRDEGMIEMVDEKWQLVT